MTIHRDLLQQARGLAQRDPTRPRQANLRRAVSSAYYALFHFVTDQASRTMIGTQLSEAPYRHVIARGFNHGTMKEACRSFSGGNLPSAITGSLPPTFTVPHALRFFAQTFVELQEQRHAADYNLAHDFTRREVLSLVIQVEHALRQFELVTDRPLKRFFLSCLWSWNAIIRR